MSVIAMLKAMSQEEASVDYEGYRMSTEDTLSRKHEKALKRKAAHEEQFAKRLASYW